MSFNLRRLGGAGGGVSSASSSKVTLVGPVGILNGLIGYSLDKPNLSKTDWSGRLVGGWVGGDSEMGGARGVASIGGRGGS